jgi:hypothetical protein
MEPGISGHRLSVNVSVAGRLASTLLAAAVAAASPVATADAQTLGRQIPIVDANYNRVTTISPLVGPPGTAVTVRAEFLPAVTPVQISLGGIRAGFEVLYQVMTTKEGELSEDVTLQVPIWAEPDRTYVFMVLDLYFAPLAVSNIFHVTAPDGTVIRKGPVTTEGQRCPAMRGETGELYTLSGDYGEVEPGDHVVVQGVLTETSVCGQGATLEVRRIERSPGAGVLPGEASR